MKGAIVADEGRIRAVGEDLLGRVVAQRNLTAALLEWLLRDEAAKLRLFRFIDVLPVLAEDREVVAHLREYFGGQPVPFGRLVQTALGLHRAGRLGDRLVAAVLRRSIRRLARRFIAGETAEEAIAAALAARRAGQAFTLDLLGEACVSEEEAVDYQGRYLMLVERLGRVASTWPSAPRLDEAAGRVLPRINISVKVSALDPFFDPIDSDGSARAVKARLRPILDAARAHAAHIHFDMEERRLKDLTLRVFTELAEEAAFRTSRNLGVVQQAYLTAAEADARRLCDWARRRGTPVTVRLVKGAYWDYETAHARLVGWPVPVWGTKSETDASFERLTRFYLEGSDAIDLAIGTHNVRSIAHAIVTRDALGLAPGQLEFQVLYGMAGPLARVLAERGERVRVYMPFGALIPGMGYLVRRLLENSSNESFLRQSRAGREGPEILLADPARAVTAPRREESAPPSSPNEPHSDFALAERREQFRTALGAVRSRFGRYYPLVIGDAAVETSAELLSRNPSRPAEVVGRAASAGAAEVDQAVAAAARAFPGWRERGAAERGRLLAAAAERLRQRRDELAAWIVHEAGKPWREADADVAEAIDFLEYYRREAVALLAGRRLGSLRGELNDLIREPLGVVGVIAPWNFPLAILAGMTSAALATGNTVVLKPAEQTPVIAAEFTAVLREAGLPAGVVNCVPGSGEVAGARLVEHPDVSLIAFTGSREVGTRIYAAAAQPAPGARHLKRVIAEMGGKNAVIVDEDADLDEAVAGLVTSAFGYAGQKCSACARVIAVGRVYERLIDRLVAAARTVPFGPADHPATIVGPLIDAAAVERVRGAIEFGKRVARPALVRDTPPELAALDGYYVGPAIFADVPAVSSLARDEIFGPVLAVMSAPDFGAALDLALDSDYALAGGVFSRSAANLAAARERFRVGNLYVNRAITGALVGRQPFGGRQLSGLGHQAGGPDYLLQFVEGRVVSENTLRRGFVSGRLA
jgi:RHH-type transcriptional regulator, proline utilization regulon repressor / proline dehydrogenase / delta 1-pyrroline-5-carboxylate dehydrogenase